MKLNLLPTTVSKGKQAQSAVLFSVIIGVAGLLIGGYLNVTSNKALDQAKSDQQASVGPAQEAYNKSVEADTIMNDAKSVALIRDANLATAMKEHNSVYPSLYEGIKPYIPAFFRINSMSATSAGDANANVTLVGTLDTYQQYADLMLAFSRYPGLVSISRGGFISRDEVVPNISPIDTIGRPRRLDAAPIPDDKLDRLAYFQSTVQSEGYTGEGNFGTGSDATRGAMPESSLVTVNMTIKADLRVPEPRQTLTAGAGSATSSAAATGGTPPGIPVPPSGAGRGAPAAGSSAPGASAGTGSGSKKGGKGAGDDSD